MSERFEPSCARRFRALPAALLLVASCAGCSGDAPAPQEAGAVEGREAGPPVLSKITTERLGRLADPRERQAVGIFGTDLGASFMAGGRLHFLFGDSWSLDPSRIDRDSVARLGPEHAPDGPPALSWYTARDGLFLPLRVPMQSGELDLGTFNVPVEGLEIEGTQYVFFASEFDPEAERHRLAALAHTRRPLAFDDLVLDHAVESDRFINVSTVVAGQTVYIFGSGKYRESPVFLARVDQALLPERQRWEYLSGRAPITYVAGNERAAMPLIDASCVGELSVRFDRDLGLYLMAYNCIAEDQPRGIHLRAARAPEGPWSEPLVIFDPDRDDGYGHFIHRARCDKKSHTNHCIHEDDGLADHGREHEWGGEYGPYLIVHWSTGDERAGLHTIFYALSSWNPYEVHLMKTVLSTEDDSEAYFGTY